MTLHLHSPYYVIEQCEEKSTLTVKEKKPLLLRSPYSKNDLIGQLWKKPGFEHLSTPGVRLLVILLLSLCPAM